MFFNKHHYQKKNSLLWLILLVGQCFFVVHADVGIQSLTQNPENPVIEGEILTYSITVSNPSANPAFINISIESLGEGSFNISGAFQNTQGGCSLDGIFFCGQLAQGGVQTYSFQAVATQQLFSLPIRFTVGCSDGSETCTGQSLLVNPVTEVILFAESVTPSELNLVSGPTGASATVTVVDSTATSISTGVGSVNPANLPAGGGEFTYFIGVPPDSVPGDIINDTISIVDANENEFLVPVTLTISRVGLQESIKPSSFNLMASPGSEASAAFTVIDSTASSITTNVGTVDLAIIPAGRREVTYSIVVPLDSVAGDIINDTITIIDADGNQSLLPVKITVVPADLNASITALNFSVSPDQSITTTFTVNASLETSISTSVGSIDSATLPVDGGELTYSIVVPSASLPGDIINDTITIVDASGQQLLIPVTLTVVPAVLNTSISELNLSASPDESESATFTVNATLATSISTSVGSVDTGSLLAGGGMLTYSIAAPADSVAGDIINDTITIVDASGQQTLIPVTLTVVSADLVISISEFNSSASTGRRISTTFTVVDPSATSIVANRGSVDPETLPAGGGEVTYFFVVPTGSQPGDIISDTITITNASGRRFIIPVSLTVSQKFADSSGLTPNELGVAEALDKACVDLSLIDSVALTEGQSNLLSICNELDNADPATLESALKQLTPTQTPAQANLSFQSSNTQTNNVTARMSALRGGAGGLSVSGFNVQYGGLTLPFDLFLANNNHLVQGVDSGVEDNSIVPKLGIFINGSASFGDREDTVDELGFDFNTYGLTAGVDYRFKDNLIAGGAVGFVNTDSDFNNSQGDVDIRGLTILFYSTYYLSEASYLEGIIGFGKNDFDNSRIITVIDSQAVGETDGIETTISIGGGYDFSQGPFTFGPYGNLNYIRAEIDGYTENLNSGPGLRYADQEAESLTLLLGGQVSYAISRDFGVLLPTLRLEWTHEYKDDSRFVSASFVNDPNQNFFSIKTELPDRDYFQLGLGASATFGTGRSAFFFYESRLGQDDVSLNSLVGGIRIDF